MSQLRFRYEPDDEWSGKLIVMCEANGFAGKGEAWFSPEDLRSFANAAEAYPFTQASPPSLSGGFGASEARGEQVHVGVLFEPHDVRGMVRATVRLATEVWRTEEQDLGTCAVIRFFVTYGDLAPFGSDFRDLIDGKAPEAILQSST